MKLEELVHVDRVGLVRDAKPLSKIECLRMLAELLARGVPQSAEMIFESLRDREAVQSTGIGDGVAVPHGPLAGATEQVGAVLLYPSGVAFEAIDGQPARILFAVVGPPGDNVAHLKVLTRIARLLRSPIFREELLAETSAESAWKRLCREDSGANESR